ncbi:hypothetical protein [Wolbachia endosymbiont of Oedothorax gibbosus]|nr:hypothetical protein [Wolbachia endosymbiont of Oedothorax gibbosus]
MGGAPYGYRYIDKYIGGGQALFEINEEEADVVRKVFLWVGRERARSMSSAKYYVNYNTNREKVLG